MEQSVRRLDPGYTGRFAPSPTGNLHFGSLISALASFLQARRNGGKWLIRIEDVDPPREVPGSAAAILRDLERLGFHHDGSVLYQSDRMPVYRAIVEQLLEQDKAFWCGCSRKDLPATGFYPGTCRNGIPSGKTRRAVRLRVPDEFIAFEDLIQGPAGENLAEAVGDFVILRADGLPAYQLAVVVDDAFQGVTQVLRGMDLYSSTSRQIYLHRQLGSTAPAYAHHPLAVQRDGGKLGKRFGSVPVSDMDDSEALFHALRFLGQSPPAGMSAPELLDWALAHWNVALIPARHEIVSPLFAQPG
jgi:glutamyl-Q tRNA(Asp) synthetase